MRWEVKDLSEESKTTQSSLDIELAYNSINIFISCPILFLIWKVLLNVSVGVFIFIMSRIR
jgi:hypothetical protein